MNEMTLSSRHMNRISSLAGRSEAEHAISRSRRLPTILNISLKLEGQSGVRNRDLRFSKQAALTTDQGPRPHSYWE